MKRGIERQRERVRQRDTERKRKRRNKECKKTHGLVKPHLPVSMIGKHG